VSVVGAVTRKILGVPRRVHVSKGGGRTLIGVQTGETDPDEQGVVARLAADLDALHDEVTGIRRELDEAQNRLDFTERLLAQARERGLLNAPKER
jgi:hypothetical protein